MFTFLSEKTDLPEEMIVNEYYYKVDKDEFMELMDTWNVILEIES